MLNYFEGLIAILGSEFVQFTTEARNEPLKQNSVVSSFDFLALFYGLVNK